MSAPKVRKRAVCTSCGQRKPCDQHHPARQAAAPEVTVPECPADHRVLNRMQERAGMYRESEPRTEVERVRWVFGGTLQTLMRVRGRDEEVDRRLARMGSLIATFADMLLGLLDASAQPIESFGPDPIRWTPRTFRGSRPVRRPIWRASKEPPAATDEVRAKAMFDMVLGSIRSAEGKDAGLPEIDVGRLMARLAELEEECALDSLVVVVDDLIGLFACAVRATSPTDIIHLASGFRRIAQTERRLTALFIGLGSTTDLPEARRSVEAFVSWYENEGRPMSETAGYGSKLPSDRGQGLHDEEAPRR
jgi:hypothetical protein